MANDIEFVDGLIIKPPHERAPDFVKAQISIKVEDLGKWLREQYKAGKTDWINIDVKEAKSGKWYAAVSTFKPEKKATGSGNAPAKTVPGEEYGDIPFISDADPIFAKLHWSAE